MTSIRRGRTIALRIAQGLHFLHSRRIVHLDLKSPNVLLSREGGEHAKIADVGLARSLNSQCTLNPQPRPTQKSGSHASVLIMTACWGDGLNALSGVTRYDAAVFSTVQRSRVPCGGP